jgi:hypothetical protein
MKKHHEIGEIFFTDDSMKIDIDATTHSFRLADISTKLCNASPTERMRYEVSPAGYGIHWPLIDEDLSIDGLLNIKHAPPFGKMKAA